MPEFREKFTYSREAAKVVFNKVSSWEELNAATLSEADEKFKEATKKYWNEFVVSGVLQFDKQKGEQVLKPFTDLDGNCALGILKQAGINTENLTYIRPGESLKGAINLDTGDKFGVVYDEDTYTTYFDHHKKGEKEVTSTTEIMYKTMADLGLIEKTKEMERVVDFVTKIDNRQFPAEEFLRSAKTILGLQRGLKFEQLVEYFKDRESPTEELTLKELEKYGLREAAEKQQEVVDESMAILEKMEKEGKIIQTKYGSLVINENNELKTGASAAYVKYDGIINFTPGKSFAVTLKERDFDERELREKLGDKFQGKIIRGKMWIYNDAKPLDLTIEEIISSLHNKESEKRKRPPRGRMRAGFRNKAIEEPEELYDENEISFETRMEIKRLVPKGSFMVFYPISLIKGMGEVKEIEKRPREGFFYSSGWNGSYHDSYNSPMLIAWARGPHKMRRARRMMRAARAWYETQEKKDSAEARFEARRQVREGD